MPLHFRLNLDTVSFYVVLIVSGLLACTSQANDTPLKRIVSIDGSITETIYALGAEQALVGVDTTSRYPVSATSLPNVGYMRALSSEGIMVLNPELVISSAHAGPQKVINNLSQAGLDIIIIDTANSISGVQEKISTIANTVNKAKQGESLSLAVAQKTQRALNKIKHEKPARILFLLAAGNRGVMVAGNDTQASAMIEIIGGINVADQFNSYKPLTPESAAKLNPDALVIANTSGTPFDFDKHPTLKLTKAYQNNRIVDGDSMLLLGFGPRIGDAIELMIDGVYPNHSIQSSQLNNTLLSDLK